MDRLDRYFGVHGQALGLRGERLTILASNIANAATPGFKARDLDFSGVLSASAQSGLGLSKTSARHIDSRAAALEPSLLYRVPVQPSLDGNTVELATEQLQFTETAVRYRSTLSALNGRIGTLMSAMKVE